jgi:hypothetical protein
LQSRPARAQRGADYIAAAALLLLLTTKISGSILIRGCTDNYLSRNYWDVQRYFFSSMVRRNTMRFPKPPCAETDLALSFPTPSESKPLRGNEFPVDKKQLHQYAGDYAQYADQCSEVCHTGSGVLAA